MSVKNNPVVFLTRKTWEYSKGNRKNVILYLTLFVIANSIILAEPLVVAKILNVIQQQGITQENMFFLFSLLGLFFVLTISFWSFHGPARVIELRNAFLVRANYKKYLLDGTMALPAEWHTDHHSGDTIDKIEKGTSALYRYSENTFQVIETIVHLVGSYIALVYFNFHASYIVLFMVITTLTFIVKFDKILVRQFIELNRAENRISEKVFDVLSNITTVIILRIERLVSKAIFKRIMQPFGLYRRNSKISEVKWFLVALSSTAMVFLVLASYIFFNVRAGSTILVGTIYALYGYVEKINGLFFRFAYMYGAIVQQRASVMNAEEVSREFKKRRKTKAINLGSDWNELKIDSLAFSYHTKEGADLHLDDLSLVIGRNERIALIGESGSGKSTFLMVFRDLYHPSYVRLYLDGKLLSEGFRSISEEIALIPQDPEIFSTTILENITVGVPHELSYVKKFTDMACFTEVIESLPNKFSSSIVEKGVNLSGGEKQRLALARGLMACDDKSIVLLDEPTSSVDLKNELNIYQNIFREFKNKTILASVHSLHLLSLFDKVYFFSDGKIIASGTFDDLVKNSKDFQEIWSKYNETERKFV